MAEAHHRVLLKLVDRARIDAFVQVVLPRRIVAECDPSLCEGSLGVPACFAVPACLAVAGGFRREQLEKPVVRVVDDLGRRPGKILMRPRIRQDMHSDAGGLEAFVFGQIYCLHQKVAVGAADESIFCLIDARALLRVRLQVPGQKMEGSPDPRNILKPKKVRAGVHHLQLQLCGGRFGRPADGGEQRSRAAVRKLGAVTDRKTLLVGIPCQKGRAICRIIMKVNLHFVFSFLSLLQQCCSGCAGTMLRSVLPVRNRLCELSDHDRRDDHFDQHHNRSEVNEKRRDLVSDILIGRNDPCNR